MTESNEVILSLKHMQKSYGAHKVLKDISFDINKGEIVTIIGPSGGGKSTTLRCINLLEEPTGGEIDFHGENILAPGYNRNTFRSKVGMVFQQFDLFENKNVLENCMIGQELVLKRSKDEARKIAMENLKKVGMDPFIKAKPQQLSGGQQQRVAIARAISIHRPTGPAAGALRRHGLPLRPPCGLPGLQGAEISGAGAVSRPGGKADGHAQSGGSFLPPSLAGAAAGILGEDHTTALHRGI